MSYLDRVRACNRLDLTDQNPFAVDGAPFGYVSRDRASVLREHKDVFTVSPKRVTFAKDLATPKQRSAALKKITPALVASGLFDKPRGELYAAKRAWSDPPAFTLDRKLVAAFGLRSFGVHINGTLENADGLHLWIGTRAADRDVEPGKFDNMVAGGQPAGLTLMENVIKECDEEAGIPAFMARTARPVGAISYAFTSPGGVKADTMFCYDLPMPAEIAPLNKDGEIAGFTLMPIAEVLQLIRETERFKFNVSLVILDFALRQGLLDPDQEPDFDRIVAGLHRRPGTETENFIMSEQ